MKDEENTAPSVELAFFYFCVTPSVDRTGMLLLHGVTEFSRYSSERRHPCGFAG